LIKIEIKVYFAVAVKIHRLGPFEDILDKVFNFQDFVLIFLRIHLGDI